MIKSNLGVIINRFFEGDETILKVNVHFFFHSIFSELEQYVIILMYDKYVAEPTYERLIELIDL